MLLGTQLYFWLHLHELVNKIEPNAEGWNVAWIGIYSTRISFAVALISSTVLPVVAAAILAQKLALVGYPSRRWAVLVSTTVWLVSVGLSLVAGSKLWRLRRGALAEMAMPSGELAPVSPDAKA